MCLLFILLFILSAIIFCALGFQLDVQAEPAKVRKH
jgi:hypothetical protein